MSSECPELHILDCCILFLLSASILFSESNLDAYKIYRMHDSLPDKLNFCTGQTVLSLKGHREVQVVICLSSVRYEI